MRKKYFFKMSIIFLGTILVLAGIMLFSNKFSKIPLIENIKKIMNIRRK